MPDPRPPLPRITGVPVMVIAFGAALFAAGCAEGREPPAPTERVVVTGGSFMFGAERPCLESGETDVCDLDAHVTADDLRRTRPQVRIKLEPFEIDRHEVTNLQYEYCVAMEVCPEPPYHNALASTQKDYYANPRYNHYPVVHVTFAMAETYCAFVGGRLPTEAEWERVAKGPEARKYPAEGCERRADCRAMGLPTHYCAGSQETERAPRLLDDGGYQSPSQDLVGVAGEPVYHLFGNVAEWVADWWDPRVTCRGATAEEKDPPCLPCWKCDPATPDDTCHTQCQRCDACDEAAGGCAYACDFGADDPADYHSRRSVVCNAYPDVAGGIEAHELWPASGLERVVRGGSVGDTGAGVCHFESTGRDKADPLEPKPTIGFRCARSL